MSVGSIKHRWELRYKILREDRMKVVDGRDQMINLSIIAESDNLPICNVSCSVMPREGEYLHIGSRKFKVLSVSYYFPLEGEDYTCKVYRVFVRFIGFL